jgi:hypothetical protein
LGWCACVWLIAGAPAAIARVPELDEIVLELGQVDLTRLVALVLVSGDSRSDSAGALVAWRRLHSQFGNEGLRVVVVEAADSGGSCESKYPWADKVYCEGKQLAKGLGLARLPYALLWSWWSGGYLELPAVPEQVESEVARVMASWPRLAIAVFGSGQDRECVSADCMRVRRVAELELVREGRFQIVADAKTRAQLIEMALAQRTYGPGPPRGPAIRHGAPDLLLRIDVTPEGTSARLLDVQEGLVRAASTGDRTGLGLVGGISNRYAPPPPANPPVPPRPIALGFNAGVGFTLVGIGGIASGFARWDYKHELRLMAGVLANRELTSGLVGVGYRRTFLAHPLENSRLQPTLGAQLAVQFPVGGDLGYYGPYYEGQGRFAILIGTVGLRLNFGKPVGLEVELYVGAAQDVDAAQTNATVALTLGIWFDGYVE